MTIRILERAGVFAESKELAREIRNEQIIPTIQKGQQVVLDFDGVRVATQSFLHVLLREVMVKQGIEALDLIEFKNCSGTVKIIIQIVVEYVQASIEINEPA